MIDANQNEKTLLALVARGDRNAFTLLYTQYVQPLHRYIYLFTKSEEEAKEIQQEIFIKIWENREKLALVEAFEAYLFRVARNRMLDKVRHLQVQHRVMMEIRRTAKQSETTTSDQCAYREYYLVVQQAIAKLPPKRRLIFQLNIENGLSQDEIAAQLEISTSVVQKQLYKATSFVRSYLFKHGEIAIAILFSLHKIIFWG